MHGRGIAMARALTFKDLTYTDNGREVVGTIETPRLHRHS